MSTMESAAKTASTDDPSDEQLAAILADEPRVRVDERAGELTIEVQEERLPARPDECPVCGESYEKRKFFGDADTGERYARYYHGGWSSGCLDESADWQAKETVTVSLERAKRVSGR